MSMPDPIDAIRDHLLADTDVAALVGTRAWGGQLPEDEDIEMPRPNIVVTHAGGGTFGGAWQDYIDLRFDVFSYGATAQEAGQVWRAVHRALKGMSREVQAGVLLHWARAAGGPNSLYDPDTEWPYVLSTWQVLFAEVST